VTGRTSVLALIADPVAQARTPALANAALAARGGDAVLVPMRVARDDLAAVVTALRAVGNFRGAVVSMPHKVAIASMVDALTGESRQAGACNVVRRARDGRLEGTMLDGEGFVAGLRGAGHEVRGRRVFLAGAGGAAAGIAFALAAHGVRALTIHNRTSAKAEALTARVRAAYPEVEVRSRGSLAGHDLVVNATSLGMQPGDALPVDPADLEPGTLAADVVIHPETPFLAEAARRGCAVHAGEAMLRAQIGLMLDYLLTWQGPLA
jgi:shikimate dehydrogenase